jgi:hypothetical protein
MDEERRVVDEGGVAIGRTGRDGWVLDFGGVRIGRVLDDDVVEDFGHVHIGAVAGSAAAHRAVAA